VILDEYLLAGEVMETSKTQVMRAHMLEGILARTRALCFLCHTCAGVDVTKAGLNGWYLQAQNRGRRLLCCHQSWDALNFVVCACADSESCP